MCVFHVGIFLGDVRQHDVELDVVSVRRIADD